MMLLLMFKKSSLKRKKNHRSKIICKCYNLHNSNQQNFLSLSKYLLHQQAKKDQRSNIIKNLLKIKKKLLVIYAINLGIRQKNVHNMNMIKILKNVIIVEKKDIQPGIVMTKILLMTMHLFNNKKSNKILSLSSNSNHKKNC